MNPSNLAMFGQAQGGAPTAPPGMPPQGGPSPIPPGPPPVQAPGGQMPMGQPQNGRYTPQEMAALGRFGDKILAHLTPGEIAVPPQAQTPKVLAVLKQAFSKVGADPQQFTAGSPQANVNPKTGEQEFSIWSAILPAILGAAGSAFGGDILPGSMSPLVSSSIGAGLGQFGGQLLTGSPLSQAALGGLGAGAGSYGLGSLDRSSTVGGLMGQTMTPDNTNNVGWGGALASQQQMPTATGAMGAINNMNPLAALGGALGGYLGNSLGTPQKSNPPAYPPGFQQHMTPASQLPNARTLLGQSGNPPMVPQFQGFNPNTLYSGAYNFFPQQAV